MSNSWFQFKKFIIHQDRCAMKVTTDACLFGAWAALEISKTIKEFGNIPGVRMLDIGTGTGLLSLMVAQKNEGSIEAIELDPEASGQAAMNFEQSPWKDRIQMTAGDIRSFESGSGYDIIICNPPFYEQELNSPDPQKNRAHHSTDLLLEDLFKSVDKNLQSKGRFYLLLPFERWESIHLLINSLGFEAVEMVRVRQTSKHPPFRVLLHARKKEGKNFSLLENEIIIKDENDQYTPAFRELLKDFYLNL